MNITNDFIIKESVDGGITLDLLIEESFGGDGDGPYEEDIYPDNESQQDSTPNIILENDGDN